MIWWYVFLNTEHIWNSQVAKKCPDYIIRLFFYLLYIYIYMNERELEVEVTSYFIFSSNFLSNQMLSRIRSARPLHYK